MHKQSDRSLDNINFVQDLTPEAAATYSGSGILGAVLGDVSRNEFNPDIIFYTGRNLTGTGYMLDADGPGEDIASLAPGGRYPTSQSGIFFEEQDGRFHDTFESFELIRGDWLVWQDVNYQGSAGRIRTPGKFNLSPTTRNKVSSLARVG